MENNEMLELFNMDKQKEKLRGQIRDEIKSVPAKRQKEFLERLLDRVQIRYILRYTLDTVRKVKDEMGV